MNEPMSNTPESILQRLAAIEGSITVSGGIAYLESGEEIDLRSFASESTGGLVAVDADVSSSDDAKERFGNVISAIAQHGGGDDARPEILVLHGLPEATGAVNPFVDRLDAITPQQISAAAQMDDLDDAVYSIQHPVGITDGGVAGMVFTGDKEEAWPSASAVEREAMLREWIEVERAYAAG